MLKAPHRIWFLNPAWLGAFLCIATPVFARSVIVTFDPDHSITGLRLVSPQETKQRRLFLEGSFHHKFWNLYREGRKVDVRKSGDFTIVLTAPEHATSLVFMAYGPNEQFESETIRLSPVPWEEDDEKIKPQAPKPAAPPPVSHPVEVTATKPQISDWSPIPAPQKIYHDHLSIGANLLTYPIVEFDRVLTEPIALGVLGTTLNGAIDSDIESAYGAFATVTYFFDKPFVGFSLQGGAGIFSTKITVGGQSVTKLEPAVRGVAQWRWAWSSLDLGVGAGVQYLHVGRNELTARSRELVQPVLQIDFGVLF